MASVTNSVGWFRCVVSYAISVVFGVIMRTVFGFFVVIVCRVSRISAYRSVFGEFSELVYSFMAL